MKNMKVNIEEFNLQEDEIFKDNMIFCKKCNGKRLFIDDELKICVRCLCDCQAEKRKKEDEENKRLERIENIRKNSLIGERYKNATFNNCVVGFNSSFDNAFNRCKAYINHLDECYKRGLGLFLYGSKGTGKSHLSVCMANEIINNCYNVMFTNFFDITKEIKKTFKNNSEEDEADVLDRISNIDFLIIDDLGTETLVRNNEDTWIQEKIYDLLNKRYNNMKPTIFTSNHSLAELVNERGLMDKTADRILEMSNAIIKIEGQSYRREKRKVEIPF